MTIREGLQKKSVGGPTLGLGASGKWMMVRMVTIIHLSEGSTQPAVYMIQIQLGGTSPWSLQWGDQP